ncbi:hypothetical protein [Microvirga arabica]|uniref:Uncharacterized protein n=1 Tax=Microvirga arabica TaxID=1128671 RepID=A0ABV6Y972_9HYPH|nr:hypothetical protein [Microvirga arabica]MBM1173749.1 hypothetical protein [Microvirga arabica]
MRKSWGRFLWFVEASLFKAGPAVQDLVHAAVSAKVRRQTASVLLRFQTACLHKGQNSINLALTITASGKPMRNIHHGFIALAILLGPASVIITHQKITDIFQQEAVTSSDSAAIIQQAYAYCSELPPFQRPSRCGEYLHHFERCAAQKDRCRPQSVYEVLIRLNLSPAPSEMPKIDTVAVTGDE